MYLKHFGRKQFFSNKFFYRTLSKISSAFWQFFFIGLCLSCILRVHKYILCQKSSLGLKNLDFTCPLEKCDERDDFKKKVLPDSDMHKNLVCFLSKLLRHYTARENCIICVHINIFETKSFFVKNWIFLFVFLGHWSVFYRPSSKTFLPVLSKLQSKCPQEQFKEKNFKIIYNVFVNFRRWVKTLWLSGKIFSVGLSQLHATCP